MTDDTDLPSDDRRGEMFAALVAAQDDGVRVARSRGHPRSASSPPGAGVRSGLGAKLDAAGGAADDPESHRVPPADGSQPSWQNRLMSAASVVSAPPQVRQLAAQWAGAGGSGDGSAVMGHRATPTLGESPPRNKGSGIACLHQSYRRSSPA
jgi:hypothetical protein